MYAEQYGDLAFEKDEVFVTYEGLQRLAQSRIGGGNVRSRTGGVRGRRSGSSTSSRCTCSRSS